MLAAELALLEEGRAELRRQIMGFGVEADVDTLLAQYAQATQEADEIRVALKVLADAALEARRLASRPNRRRVAPLSQGGLGAEDKP